MFVLLRIFKYVHYVEQHITIEYTYTYNENHNIFNDITHYYKAQRKETFSI